MILTLEGAERYFNTKKLDSKAFSRQLDLLEVAKTEKEKDIIRDRIDNYIKPFINNTISRLDRVARVLRLAESKYILIDYAIVAKNDEEINLIMRIKPKEEPIDLNFYP